MQYSVLDSNVSTVRHGRCGGAEEDSPLSTGLWPCSWGAGCPPAHWSRSCCRCHLALGTASASWTAHAQLPVWKSHLSDKGSGGVVVQRQDWTLFFPCCVDLPFLFLICPYPLPPRVVYWELPTTTTTCWELGDAQSNQSLLLVLLWAAQYNNRLLLVLLGAAHYNHSVPLVILGATQYNHSLLLVIQGTSQYKPDLLLVDTRSSLVQPRSTTGSTGRCPVQPKSATGYTSSHPVQPICYW